MTTPLASDTPAAPPPRPPRSERFLFWIAGLGIARSDGWVGGVAAGIAARLRIDPLIVRGILVVATLFGLPLIFLYAVAWALLPDADGRVHLRELLRGRFEPAHLGILAAAVIGLVPVVPLVPSILFGLRVGLNGFGVFLFIVGIALVIILLALIVRAARRTPGDPAVRARMPRTDRRARRADAATAVAAETVTSTAADGPPPHQDGAPADTVDPVAAGHPDDTTGADASDPDASMPDAAGPVGLSAAGSATGEPWSDALATGEPWSDALATGDPGSDALGSDGTASDIAAPDTAASGAAASDTATASEPAEAADLTAWRAQHAAWREQDQAWRRWQQDADRAARDQIRRERQASAAQFAAEASERRRVRRMANPRIGAAYFAAVAGLAIVAGAIVGIVSERQVAVALGLFVAGLVLAFGMVIAGIARRRSGLLAFVTALTIVGGAVAAVPAVLGGTVVIGQYSASNLRSQDIHQLAGYLTLDLSHLEDAATHRISVQKNTGYTDITVGPGTTLELNATLGDVEVDWVKMTLHADGSAEFDSNGTWTGSERGDGTTFIHQEITSSAYADSTAEASTVVPVVLDQRDGTLVVTYYETDSEDAR